MTWPDEFTTASSMQRITNKPETHGTKQNTLRCPRFDVKQRLTEDCQVVTV